MKHLALIGLLLVAMVGNALAQTNATKGYTTSPNGILYKVHKTNKKGQMPKEGEVMFLNLKVKTEKPDTLLFTSVDVEKREGLPYFELLSKPMFKGDYAEILALMHIGDSVTAKINADTFFHYVFKMERADLPFKVEPGSNVAINIRMDSIMTMDTFKLFYNKVMADKDAKAFDLENKNIADFIATNKIEVTPTPTGLYYIETKPGTGRKALPNDSIKVTYTGMFMDGSVFDSNEDAGNMAMIVGVGMVIPGFDEALQLMAAGAEATVIIPYRLGYGVRGFPPVIPPFATLIFNLKLVEIIEPK